MIIKGGSSLYGHLDSLITDHMGEWALILSGGICTKAKLLPGMIEQLKPRVGTQVGFDGEAYWDTGRNLALCGFNVTAVNPYDPVNHNLVSTFEALAEASAGAWDGVDAAEYVRQLRED